MTPPLTGYETHGDWTTLAEETAVLTQIAAETGAVHTVIAHDALGNPVHRVDLGAIGAPTVLIVALQHGNEPAPRESALAHLRDCAYSTDPDVVGYLATHRLVYIPTANPSGLPDTRSGVGYGGDINRSHLNQARPEARGIAATIADVDPHIILDMHEYLSSSQGTPDHWGDHSRLPAQAPALLGTSTVLYEHINDRLQSAGISAGRYPAWNLGMLHLTAASWDAIGILSETHKNLDVSRRVTIGREVIDTVIAWHADNVFECESAKVESRRHSMTRTEKFTIVNTASSAHSFVDLSIAGYQLDGPLPERAQVFGVEQDPDGFVPLAQARGAVVPYLFDPESPYRLADGVRVPRPPEAPRGEPVRWRINVDGLVRDVKKAWINTGEGVRAVRVPGT